MGSSSSRNSEAHFKTAHVEVPSGADGDAELPTYEPPNLAEAREFYYTTLPRRIPDNTQPSGYRLARPGELFDEKNNPAVLYDPYCGKVDAFDEFGVGISMYFRTLKVLFWMLLLCAFISLTAVYRNRQFNPDEDDIDHIKEVNNYNATREATPRSLIGSTYGAEREDLKFGHQGASDIVCCCLIGLLALISGYIQKQTIKKIDVAQQTAQDYTIVIENPPRTATDPQVYYDHFKKFGDIAMVTVVLNNGVLLKALAEKKVLERRLDALKVRLDGKEQEETILHVIAPRK